MFKSTFNNSLCFATAIFASGASIIISGCKPKATVASQSEPNCVAGCIGDGIAIWQLVAWIVGGSTIFFVVNQQSQEIWQFDSKSKAQDFLNYASSNQGAMARPARAAASVPSAINRPCRNQKRPNEGSCEASTCYLSPSPNNAQAARRILSHQSGSSQSGQCFVWQWQGNNWGHDSAHDWKPHYHLYRIDEQSGQCLENAHFYYTNDKAEFDKYSGPCQKF